MTSPTIDTLLALRQTRRIGVAGDAERARGRLPLSQMLADTYVQYAPLRKHLFHP